MTLNLGPIDTKKKDIGKIVNELVRLNFSWWKKQVDLAIYKAFCAQLAELGAESMEVAESYFLHLNTWALSKTTQIPDKTFDW